MTEKLLGSDDLQKIAWDAQDVDKEVYVQRSEIDEDIILHVEVDGETYYNDLFDVEMDNSDEAAARRYYYG